MNTTHKFFSYLISFFFLVQLSVSIRVDPVPSSIIRGIQIDINESMNKQLKQGKVPKANNQTFFHYKNDDIGPNHSSYFRMDTCHPNSNCIITFYNETFVMVTYFQTFEDCKRKEFNGIVKQYIYEIDWVGKYEDIPFKDVALHFSDTTEDCSTFDEVQTFTLDSCTRVNSEETERYTLLNFFTLVMNKFEGMECDQYLGYGEYYLGNNKYYSKDECVKTKDGKSYYHSLTMNSSIMPFLLCTMIILLLI